MWERGIYSFIDSNTGRRETGRDTQHCRQTVFLFGGYFNRTSLIVWPTLTLCCTLGDRDGWAWTPEIQFDWKMAYRILKVVTSFKIKFPTALIVVASPKSWWSSSRWIFVLSFCSVCIPNLDSEHQWTKGLQGSWKPCYNTGK